jgi:hypothetical protein
MPFCILTQFARIVKKLDRAEQKTRRFRNFRLDRIVSVEPGPLPVRSLTGCIGSKIRRRGIIVGLWGLFLDFLVIACVGGLIFAFLVGYLF